MTPRTIQSDYIFGLSKEEEVKPLLEQFFGVPLSRTKDRFCPYDFEGQGIVIELKSRTNKKSAFPDTRITKAKVDKILLSDAPQKVLCFNFTDGIFYCLLDDETVNTFKTVRWGRCDRGRAEFSHYYAIPVGVLMNLKSSSRSLDSGL